MPSWLGSIRVRLAVLYSVLLFGLASIVVGLIYVALWRSLDDEPVSRTQAVAILPRTADGQPVVIFEGEVDMPEFFAVFEREVNRRTLEELRQWSFGAIAGLFVASLGVGWWVSGLVMRPVGRITSVAREISATDLNRRIHLRGPNDELRQLADTFDDMLARLGDAFEGQRRFIQDASHELRNPLAVMRTNLEVALADPDASAEDLRHTAEVVSRTSERMSTLVDDLIVYARNEMPATRVGPVDLSALVEELATEFRIPAESQGVTVTLRSETGCWCRGDSFALRRAGANLLDNAVRHSAADSTIVVSCGRAEGWVFLSVADQGPGIEQEQHELVFQRFWRGRERRTGNGLGLTIVRQIAEAHGGRATLRSEPGVGSTFVVWVPAVPDPGSQQLPS